MKFSLNVKPLKDAMDLGIISGNISKFFEKSTVVELSVTGSELQLNTQATSLLSEATIKGNNEDGGDAYAIVDCMLFKSLIGSLDSNTVTLDFQDTSVVVKSGKSKFNVPKLLTDEDDVSLDKPVSVNDLGNKFCGQLDVNVWKYIKDHQLYALASSMVYKVYTKVWVDKEQGVLTGDSENSMFTYYPKGDLQGTNLVSSTIVNLLSSLEETTKLYSVDTTTYVACMSVDSFDFRAQFTVDVDGDSRIGDYGSDMIFNMVLDDSQSEVPVSKDNMYADIKRASLFSSAFNPTITLKADDNGVYLVNDNVNCCLNSDSSDIDYELVFNVSELDTVVSHMDLSDLSMSPVVKEGEVLAIRFKSDNGFVALIGGIG